MREEVNKKLSVYIEFDELLSDVSKRVENALQQQADCPSLNFGVP